jgi:hypothetical protein
LPTVFQPFESPVESDQIAQSERLSTQITNDLTTRESSAVLNHSAATDFFAPGAGPTSAPDLRTRYGMRQTVNVNVTLLTPDSSGRSLCPNAPRPARTSGTTSGCAVGEDVGDRAVAVSTRVVRDGGFVCKPSCRIVVRVW